jgi:cadaverine:lysine antiporter
VVLRIFLNIKGLIVEKDVKKLGVIACSAVVAGNMMGSGIALLPATLSSLGSITLISWILASIGALALAFVFAKLGSSDPQPGGPEAYATEVAPILGYQTGVLYYNANWVGNLAIAVTGVAYLSVFFPVLHNSTAACILVIALVWFFVFLNILGAKWISRLVTIGVFLLLIPIILTATVGWFYFHPSQFAANWNVSHQTDWHAVSAGILFCIWSFIGLESASVNAGLVKKPMRTIPIATMVGVLVAAIVYTASCAAIDGMYPAATIAHSGAPFSLVNGMMFGHWAGYAVSAITAFACLASLGSWMMMVAQASVRAANDGTLPKTFAKLNKRDVPVRSLWVTGVMMSVLMVVLSVSFKNAQVVFNQIVSIAVLLTIFPYFYSTLRFFHVTETRYKSYFKLFACILAFIFCFAAFEGSHQIILVGAMIVSLLCLIFYERKDRTELEQRLYEKVFHWHFSKKHLYKDDDA